MRDEPICFARMAYFPFREFRVAYFEVHMVLKMALPESSSVVVLGEAVVFLGCS